MSHRHRRRSSAKCSKRMSTDFNTHVLSQGLSDLAMKTPSPMKRRRMDAVERNTNVVPPRHDFPHHVFVPPPPIHWTGQLKVSIHKTRTHILINIIRAKGLPRLHGHFCGTYVVTSIISSHHRKREMITELVNDVTRPYFEEMFPIDLGELTYRDRILITLYRQHDNRSELIGCMSFGVKHLLQEVKVINGWYYLLNEELGIKKHLAAPSKKKCQSDGRKRKEPIKVIKKVMTIMQGKQGYGFTILDTSPVRVGKVDQGGPAEQVGLQMGDVLIRINKYHVESLQCPDIITIIKNAPGHLRMVIERRVRRSVSDTTPPQQTDEMRRPLGPMSANCSDGRQSGDMRRPRGTTSTNRCDIRESDMRQPWGPPADRHTDKTRQPWGLLSANHFNDREPEDMRRLWGPVASRQSMHLYNYCGFSTSSKSSCCSSDTYPPSEEDEEIQVFGSMEEAREAAVQQLCSYEGGFSSSLHFAVEDYLKPLRYNVHMSSEFTRLYTALEQMTVICGYHVQQLELRIAVESSPAKKTQNSKPEIVTIGDVYLAKLDEFMSAFAVYQSSVRVVDSEIAAMMQHQHVWDSDEQLAIRGTIQKPSEYLDKLCQLLQMVWTSTPTEHPDHENLKHNLNTLQSIHWWSETVKDGNTRSYSSSQLKQLQEKVVFSKNVKQCKLSESGRQYVFAGTLYRVNTNDPGRLKKLWAVLCNDMLLITKRREDDTVLVLEKLPMDIVYIQGMGLHNGEKDLSFQVSVVSSGAGKQRETRTLRAPTPQLKATWKKLLNKYATGMYKISSECMVKDLQITEKKESRRRFEGITRPLLGRRKISNPELPTRKSEGTLALLNRKVSSPEIKISTVDDDNNETKLNESATISEESGDEPIMFGLGKNKNKLTVDLYKKSPSCEDCSQGSTIQNSHSFDRLITTASAPSSPSETVHISRSWNSLAPTGTVSYTQARKSDEFVDKDTTDSKYSKDTSSAKSKPKRKAIFQLFPRSSGDIKTKECTQTEEPPPPHALFLKESLEPKKDDQSPRRQPVTRVRSRSVGSEDDVIEEEDECSGSDSPNDDALQLPPFNKGNEKCKKKKNLAKDMKERLRFLRRRHTDGCLKDTEKLKSQLKSTTHAQAVKWSESFEFLLADKYGLASFRSFLKTEFSDENIEFWLACEDYKKCRPSKWSSRAQRIYNDYVAIQAPREVNLDSHSRMATISNLSNPNKHAFDLAQKRIQSLMEKDSYPRFIRSEFYQTLINEKLKDSSC